jgi:hypothetical protein
MEEGNIYYQDQRELGSITTLLTDFTKIMKGIGGKP